MTTAAWGALLGLDPIAFLREKDPMNSIIFQAVVDRGEEIAKDMRQDLANRIAKGLSG